MDLKHHLILKIILAAFSFLLNGLFFIVLARNRHLVKQKRITYHVANLAVADTLYSLTRFCFIIALLYPNELAIKQSRPLLDSMCAGFYLASQTAVLLMTIERSIVVAKPLTWNEILPRKRMLLFMLCSWIAVVTLVAVYHYLLWKTYLWSQELRLVGFTFHLVFLLSSAAVNIYMFKKLRKKDGLADSHLSTRVIQQANAQQTSMHLKRKASKLVLLLAVIMIVTCLPTFLRNLIRHTCHSYKLRCNLQFNSTILKVSFLLQILNFIVNPLVYIWKDRIYRNAFYRTFKIKYVF